MSYPAYPTYKDSGIEWLGEVPAHWEVTRLRFASVINPTKSEIADLPASTEVSFVPMEAVGEYGGLQLETTKPIEEVLQGYTYFRDGDVVLAKITPCFENGKGALAGNLVAGIAFGTTELHVLRPHPDRTDPQFLFYASISAPFRKLGEGEMYGAGGQKRVPNAFVENFKQPLPPLEEQRAIAAFLDAETAQIDTLITKQERLIALLQEKRQALISHAVTRGLNPDAPMKESGVEWLGEVPKHWEIKRLKHIAQVQTGVAKGRNLSGKETITVPYLRVANVQDGYIDLSDVATIEIGEDELERYALQPGDVLMNEGGDNDKLGRGHVWYGEIEPCIHQNHVFSVRPFGVDSEWLNLVTGADCTKFYFFSFAKQSTNLASISSSNLRELPVVCPPADERKAIQKYIQQETEQIASLIEKSKAVIERLQERRTALISAAVTGKIDVRAVMN